MQFFLEAKCSKGNHYACKAPENEEYHKRINWLEKFSPFKEQFFWTKYIIVLKGFHPCAHFEVNFNYIALDLEIGTLVCFLFACLCY